MAEASQIIYTFKELAALLVKDQDKHEGHWGVYVKFGISAMNVGQTDNDIKPTALVPVLEIGLQKFEELNNLSVDAAVVNPAGRKAAKDSPAPGALAMGKARRK
jgi:hypothetical protein